MADFSIEWVDEQLSEKRPEARGRVLAVPISGTPDAAWAHQFDANAMIQVYEPADRSWLDQPKLDRDVLTVAGVHDGTDLDALRRHVNAVVQLTNNQVARS